MSLLQFEDDLKCPICLELMVVPVTAGCGHSFCRSCVTRSVSSIRINASKCPVCRKTFSASILTTSENKTCASIITRVRAAIDKRDTDVLIAKADAGDSLSQFTLGEHHDTGARGLEINKRKAFDYFLLAAEQGHAMAQSNVGFMLYRGEVVPKDNTSALKWCLASSEQNCRIATNNLGIIYLKGTDDEPSNPLKAMKHFQSAGLAVSHAHIGVMYMRGDLGYADHIAAAAHCDYALSKNPDCPLALLTYGRLHARGWPGSLKDPMTAFSYVSRAAESFNYIPSFQILGEYHERGIGTDVNVEEAIKWYTKGADVGDGYAAQRLSVLVPDKKDHWVARAKVLGVEVGKRKREEEECG